MSSLNKPTKTSMFNFIVLVLALSGCIAALSAFQARRQLDQLEILSSGYPRSFFFRRSENVSSPYETWEKTFNRLGGIMGKAMNEELLGRNITLPYFQKYKKDHPTHAVFLHYNGNARDPLDAKAYFDGHWIYYEGTPLLQNLEARDGELVIKVANASLFKMNIGNYKNKNDDLAICRKNPDGSLDWNYAEQLKLIKADYKNNTLTVKRAQYGSIARKFDASNSVVSPHAVEGPWGEKNNLLWLYNHSTLSPKDRNGRSCDDVLISEIAGHFKPGGQLNSFDGVEFDVLWNELKNENNATARRADIDANGKGDNGLIDGINQYSIGVFNFCKNLRQAVGNEKLIMADGMTAMFQRGVGYLNGIESEGWPHLRDPEIEDWSGGWNRHLFWNENAAKPRFNFVNFKYALNVKPPPLGRQRLVWAASQLFDANITSAGYIIDKPEDGIRFGITDEFVAGIKQKKYWLGKPLGPTVRMALQQEDLLKGKGIKPGPAFLAQLSGSQLNASIDGEALKLSSTASNLQFSIKDIPTNGPDLLVSVMIKCASRKGYPANMPRLMSVKGGRSEHKMMSWMNDNWFHATFYLRDIQDKRISLHFEAESGDPVWLRNLSIHAYPDVAYRLFENGLVLVNPSLSSFEFNLQKISPGKRYIHLQATVSGDSQINSGKKLDNTLKLGEREGIFLERL